jgi:transposase IS200-family protein
LKGIHHGKETIKYCKTQHSVYSITLHLVLVVKHRRNVIDDVISERIKNIFEWIGSTHGVEIIKWNHDKDHIHTILSISPSTNLNKYINAAKAASSRLIKKEFPLITLKLYKDVFWTRGFYISSTGSTQIDVVKNYILNQGEK